MKRLFYISLLLITVLLSSCLSDLKQTYQETIYQHNLIAIQNNAETTSHSSGWMFASIGTYSSGSTVSKKVYVYEETGTGTFKMKEYNYSDVEFAWLSDSLTVPYIEKQITVYEFEDGSVRYFDGIVYTSAKNKANANAVYILHIPKGSIEERFDLNLDNLK